jgi:hypothetical protein
MNNSKMNGIFIVGDVVQFRSGELFLVERIRWIHDAHDWLHTLKALNGSGYKSYYLQRMRAETVLYKQSDLTPAQQANPVAEAITEAIITAPGFNKLNNSAPVSSAPISGTEAMIKTNGDFNPFEQVKQLGNKVISISFVQNLHD